MKKIYINPKIDTVNMRIYSSVLDDTGNYGNWSQGAAGGDEPGWGDAKENNFLWEDDLWDDGDNSSNPYDMWGDN